MTKRSMYAAMRFQLTPSRRATNTNVSMLGESFISTHALTEGDKFLHNTDRRRGISTHALTEGDLKRCAGSVRSIYFNSRPHGGRLLSSKNLIFHRIFQLTPSRRATWGWNIVQYDTYFNSRPHGGRPVELIFVGNQFGISTHALTEGDSLREIQAVTFEYFNSRPHGGRHVTLREER